MKRYAGTRKDGVAEVTVNGRPLNPRFDLWNHSPTGFEWDDGSGPAQLALALLADALEDDADANQWYQEFKREVVAAFGHDDWALTDAQIRRAVQALTNEQNVPTE